MSASPELLEQQFPQMRERCISLAADLDRLQRAEGSFEQVAQDRRYREIVAALGILSDGRTDRARRILELMSDK